MNFITKSLLASASAVLMVGCGGDAFSYADEDEFRASVVTNGIVGINLYTGSTVTHDNEVFPPEGTVANFKVTKDAKNGTVTIEEGKAVYQPNYNFQGEDKASVEQGEEKDFEYRIINLTFLVGQGLEAPVISGNPSTEVEARQFYSFTPTVATEPNKTLSFSVTNSPSWLSLNTNTGQLSGTAPNYEAEYSGIIISVNDGTRTSSMEPFDLVVLKFDDFNGSSGGM